MCKLPPYMQVVHGRKHSLHQDTMGTWHLFELVLPDSVTSSDSD
jgi:hypothetical protein